MASEYLYYQRSCMLTHLLMNICFMLMVFMLCLHCSHLLPAYAHLYMLMGSYVCLCMIMYVICLLMGHNINEGIFYWGYGLGNKGKCLGF
jgi:hypothetical protein